MGIISGTGKLDTMSREELVSALRQYMAYEERMELLQKEQSCAQTAMAKEYQSMKEALLACREENRLLREQLKHAVEQNTLKTRDVFGRSTEKLSDILASAPVEEEADEAGGETGEHADTPDGSRPADEIACKKKRHGKKTPGKRRKDLEGLARVPVFELDTEALDSEYGEGQWRIAYWHCHESLGYRPAEAYVEQRYSPVLSVGLEHMMVAVPSRGILLANSLASASIAAKILYDKFYLALPVYRQSQALSDVGIILSRQTMTNWCINFALDIFGPVYDRMGELLLPVPYQQCDESTLVVNRDGRRPGRKSYLWVHITGELLNIPPIILFCFELTRGTGHLRQFFLPLQNPVTLTSDAYGSYQTIEKELPDRITGSGCMAHCRRRFADALALIDCSSLPEEKIRALPEFRALDAVAEIYREENILRSMDAECRRIQREEKIAPLMDSFYKLIEGDEYAAPDVSEKLKEAVSYARSQKVYLTRFLHDGNIPIDDSATERVIKSYATGRRGWLFCDSIDGAKALSIMYSIVETAKANKANVYHYLRYVLENAPRHMDSADRSFLDDMLPWSPKYKEYEKEQIRPGHGIKYRAGEYESPPKPPPKRK